MLEQSEEVLHRDGWICFCGSEEMKLGEVVRGMGYDIDLLVRVRVHGGLVREVFRVCV
jgi:tRNA G10  N-methylase Trm11